MARLHGQHGEVGIAASITPEGSPSDLDFSVIGSLSSWNISFSKSPIESTSLRATAKTYLVSLEDISGGFDGTFDTDYIETLLTAGDDADGVWIRITPSTDYPELFFQGSARLNVAISGAVSDAVRASVSFVGNGAWQKSYMA